MDFGEIQQTISWKPPSACGWRYFELGNAARRKHRTTTSSTQGMLHAVGTYSRHRSPPRNFAVADGARRGQKHGFFDLFNRWAGSFTKNASTRFLHANASAYNTPADPVLRLSFPRPFLSRNGLCSFHALRLTASRPDHAERPWRSCSWGARRRGDCGVGTAGLLISSCRTESLLPITRVARETRTLAAPGTA